MKHNFTHAQHTTIPKNNDFICGRMRHIFSFYAMLFAAIVILLATVNPAQAEPFDWDVVIDTNPTVPFYNCAPGNYAFALSATPKGNNLPSSAFHFYTITGPTWSTWTGATTSNGSTATLNRNYSVGDTTTTVSVTATYSCTPKGDGECPGADELTRTGSKDVSVHIGSNTTFPLSDVSVAGGATPTFPLTGRARIWGETIPESLTIDTSVCKEGESWKAILTSVSGKYSTQFRLLPKRDNPFGYDVQEVRGPAGNTTQANFCQQLRDLNATTQGASQFYMISAVEEHEKTHYSHFEDDLRRTVVRLESSVESLKVRDTGQGATAAKQQIENSLEFQRILQGAFSNWVTEAGNKSGADHAGPAYDAERRKTAQMISTICAHAVKKGWRDSATAAPCRECP